MEKEICRNRYRNRKMWFFSSKNLILPYIFYNFPFSFNNICQGSNPYRIYAQGNFIEIAGLLFHCMAVIT